jgi:hypothetical protein
MPTTYHSFSLMYLFNFIWASEILFLRTTGIGVSDYGTVRKKLPLAIGLPCREIDFRISQWGKLSDHQVLNSKVKLLDYRILNIRRTIGCRCLLKCKS